MTSVSAVKVTLWWYKTDSSWVGIGVNIAITLFSTVYLNVLTAHNIIIQAIFNNVNYYVIFI